MDGDFALQFAHLWSAGACRPCRPQLLRAIAARACHEPASSPALFLEQKSPVDWLPRTSKRLWHGTMADVTWQYDKAVSLLGVAFCCSRYNLSPQPTALCCCSLQPITLCYNIAAIVLQSIRCIPRVFPALLMPCCR